MDPYRSPQAASLNIGSPRSLRPREQLHAPTPRYHPSIAQSMHSPVHMPEPVLASGEYAYSEHPAFHVESSSTDDSPESRGRIMGGLRNRWKRISGAFHKHHSRESLYSEYASEAQGAASQDPLRFPSRIASQALSGIPETSAELESSPGFDEPVRPSHYEVVRSDGVPSYMESDVSSSHSAHTKAPSIDIAVPPYDTWAYYWVLIVLFFLRISRLPWSSHRIVKDFVPERDGRFRKTEPQKVVQSWYTRRNRGRDAEKITVSPPQLFVVPATPQTASVFSGAPTSAFPMPVAVTSPYSDAATAIRPTRTPATVTSAGMNLASPGMSSHGLGEQSMRYSWYSSSPQQYPWTYPSHLFQASITSPQTFIDTPASGFFSPQAR
ncbi:hypothetical protein PsYK624_021560 [Phanerochaete sordida]|uniref:Uncharacterized protein n=1 Tax=Phanerochaete sordida TaxID=48140 RepID=A0A9P3G0Q1_9APHY|nr:hypothetical protein PsYK624_021560 [Phanerochaete sordida]